MKLAFTRWRQFVLLLRYRLVVLCVFGSLCSFVQGKDFNTNGFLFPVPPAWQLNSKVPAEVNVQFDIKTTNGVVPVRFKGYTPGKTNGTVSALISRWGRFVENPDKVEWQTHSLNINDRRITYVEAWGALKYFSTSGKKEIYVPHYSFFGGIIEDPKGNVSVYMLGRSSVTDQLKPEFKRVIEEAVAKKTKQDAAAPH